MYSVKGELLTLFHSPATDKYDASWKVQLLGDVPLKNGQIKKDMLTLNVPEDIWTSLQGQKGKMVTMPIGFFVSDNRLQPFYPKAAKREVQKGA